MFIASNESTLNILFERATEKCENINQCVYFLVKLIEKNYWASYTVDKVKGTFGLRGHLFLNQVTLM